MAIAEILCLYFAGSGLIRLATGRVWLPRRREGAGPGRVRRSGLYRTGVGLGVGIECAMIFAAYRGGLRESVIYGLAAGGLLLALLTGIFWAFSPGPDEPVTEDVDAAAG